MHICMDQHLMELGVIYVLIVLMMRLNNTVKNWINMTITIDEFIKTGIEYDAFEPDDIVTIKQYSSFEEFALSDDAPYYTYLYVCCVKPTSEQWLVFKPIFLRSPQYCYYYVVDILQERWEEGEQTILLSPEYSYFYALSVIKGRWKKGEQTISLSPEWSYFYACNILETRFKKGEKSILTSPQWSFYYACDVIDKRWKKAESIICSDEFYKKLYYSLVE